MAAAARLALFESTTTCCGTTAAVAKTTTTSRMSNKIAQWSLNSLARAKREMMPDPQNKTQMFAGPALEMARDVALRLGEQQIHVERMEEYVQQSLANGGGGGNQQQQRNNKSSSSNNRVIATSSFSQPYWWKQKQMMKVQPTVDEIAQQQQERHTALIKAQRNLHDLKMLHKNTQEIAQVFWDHLEHLNSNNNRDEENNNNNNLALLNNRERKWLKAAFRQIRDRHALTVENLAEFVITTRPYWGEETSSESESETSSSLLLDSTVMNFLRGRCGVQLLCEHALAPRGIICIDCDLRTVLQEAISEAQLLCESNYSHMVTAAPEVVILTSSSTKKSSPQFTIVRPWVHYVLVELLKNAMAVSMERMTNDENTCNLLPPTIYISIDDHHQCTADDDNNNCLSIDIIDQGGGFANNPDLMKSTDQLFDFVRTKDKVWDRLDDQQTYAQTRSPMQGLGVGLCLSRLMMQHFGGTVTLSSHPPLSLQHQQALRLVGGLDEGNNKLLDTGCVASIKLTKDLDQPEQLYVV